MSSLINLLAVLALVSSNSAYGTSFNVNFETLSKECTQYIASLPSHFNWGFVHVPENWNDPKKSRQIPIFYYTNFREANIPVLYINGGPLRSSWDNFKHFQLYSIPRNIGIIYFDQRGTGCSNPLNFNLSVDSFRTMSFYSTYEMVRDAEEIRKKTIGNRPWKLLGQSFGSVVINRYIELFPDSLISAHADVAPAWDTMSDFFYHRLKAQNEIIAGAEFHFPGISDRIRKAKKALTQNDCIKSQAHKICGPAMVDLLSVKLQGAPENQKKLIDEVLNSNGRVNIAALENAADRQLKFFFSNQYPYSLAVNKMEFFTNDGEMNPLKECASAYGRLKKENVLKDNLVLDECQLIDAVFKNKKLKSIIKTGLPNVKTYKPQNMSELVSNLQKVSRLKLFLYTGGYDPMVGFRAGATLSNRSPQIFNIHFPTSGHGTFRTSSEAWDILFKY